MAPPEGVVVAVTIIHLLGIYLLLKNRLGRRIIGEGRRWAVHPLNQDRNRRGVYVNLYEDMRKYPDRFQDHTRFSVRQFDDLLSRVRNRLQKRTTCTTIPVEMRLVMTLRFLASGDLPSSFSAYYRLGKSTVFNIFQETCEVIYDVLSPSFIKFPTSQDFIKIADDFYRKWNFPNCLGAIDGKHVKIQAPPNSGSSNFNYLRYFSMVLLAICDANYTFTYFDFGSAGANSDSGILRETDFGRHLDAGTLDLPEPRILPNTTEDSHKFPFVFIGDEAFALKTNMFRPYGQKKAEKNHSFRIFNYRMCRARRLIENSFGILAARFRLLHKTIQGSEETVTKYISCIVVLHNYLMKMKHLQDIGQDADLQPDVIGLNGEIIRPGSWRSNQNPPLEKIPPLQYRNAPEAAKHLRDRFAEYFVSPAGRVVWQEGSIERGIF